MYEGHYRLEINVNTTCHAEYRGSKDITAYLLDPKETRIRKGT